MSNAGDATRVSDAERQAVVDRLRTAVGEGRLTLDEFGDRTGAALAATTTDELAPLTKDLPTSQGVPIAPTPDRGFMVQIFGMGSSQGDRKSAGPWRLPKKYFGVTIFGSADIDLCTATISADGSRVTLFTLFGTTKVRVPTGVPIETGGFALFGSNHTRLDHSGLDGLPPATAVPTIGVKMYTLFGGGDFKVAP